MPLPRPVRPRSWLFASLIGLLSLAPAVAQQPAPGAAPAPAPTNPLEVPLRLIAEARQAYQGLRDYTCLFIKRERLRGQLQTENLIQMTVRAQPFSVYLRWLGPRPFTGQEVCYVAGRNNGLMRVKSTGLLGAVGFVNLDPRDPRALENSRHTITEAGLGNLIDRFTEGYDLDSRGNRTQVRVADYEYNKRRCTRVETIHLSGPTGNGGFYRSVLYLDKENKLPARVENYDWPRQGGQPGGELIEEYSYVDLRLNVGVNDTVFNK
jgi:Protein of unknown function (DUF1571)